MGSCFETEKRPYRPVPRVPQRPLYTGTSNYASAPPRLTKTTEHHYRPKTAAEKARDAKKLKEIQAMQARLREDERQRETSRVQGHLNAINAWEQYRS